MEPKLLRLMTSADVDFLDRRSLETRMQDLDRAEHDKPFRKGPMALAEHDRDRYVRELMRIAELPVMKDLVRAHTDDRELRLDKFDETLRAMRQEAIRQVTPETIEPTGNYL